MKIQQMTLVLRRGNGSYPKRPELMDRDVLLFLMKGKYRMCKVDDEVYSDFICDCDDERDCVMHNPYMKTFGGCI